MSQRLINTYLADIHRLQQLSGTSTEQVVREAFKDMLKAWAKANSLVFIPELLYETKQGTKVYPDGTILHDVRVPLGYWEAKDTADDLDTEIDKKRLKGYPQDNIIYENTETAVLWQNKEEVLRCKMTDVDALEKLLNLFFGYQRPEIAQFRGAVAQFKTDLPAVLQALREKIDDAYKSNPAFQDVAAKFLEHAKKTINPSLTPADIREMLIQHILTEEIFSRVFNEADFHRDNNIAKLLYALEKAFFTGEVKKSTLHALTPYYAAINANAAQISSHAEKQTFLKVIYENFYKVYNPAAADRLGVVYTPNEIVKFMIEGTDWLCDKHFGKRLIDPGVEILDPATGTGTYICELIEYFRGQPAKLQHKYKSELHANEVAILPYYVANLNIEATYQSVAGQYAEFPNLCFVDTLDNIAGLGIKAGHQGDLFGALSDENVERVQRQNKRKISVVIGNPPYNANQQNENDNNKNRAYPHIDDLIKRSFVKLSTAQKTKVYDMYARFFRWASDRLHDDGIIAFITNRSFIDSRTFDGFRRYVSEEFDEVYIVDLGGDWKLKGAPAGGNVFGIGTGVAISFLVRKQRKTKTKAKIYYRSCLAGESGDEKLGYLSATPLGTVQFEQVEPSKDAEWVGITSNEWQSFLPVAIKRANFGRKNLGVGAIFEDLVVGVSTNRDSWVTDFQKPPLLAKVAHFLDVLEADLTTTQNGKVAYSNSIKWSEGLKALNSRSFDFAKRVEPTAYMYRPFNEVWLYSDPKLCDRLNNAHKVSYGASFDLKNATMVFTDPTAQKPFMSLATDILPDLHLVGSGAGAMGLPRHRYASTGERLDNITDWALAQFTAHYGAGITKDAIFAYVYAVLHDPIYRETYALNLKREFPRIPFYPNFAQWQAWGQTLLDLHIGYEGVSPWPLHRRDVPDTRAAAAGLPPKPALKADKAAGTITLDSETTLSGIPPECWDYKLGNRSGLEWVLDQYKEKTPKDPTIREKFNTYRFADYKEHVAALLARVTRVSVETMAITNAMRDAPRDGAN